MAEDWGFWLVLIALFLWWFFFNLYFFRAGKKLGEDVWYIWLILPIFYICAYIELAKKSYWNLVWLIIPYIGYWGFGHFWLTYNVCKRLGVSGWWILAWPVAPFFWDIEKIKGSKYFTWECEYCKREFKTEKQAAKHEKTCKQRRD